MEYALIESGRWKLIYHRRAARTEAGAPPAGSANDPPPGRLELFDLQNDPEERYDVLTAHPDILRRLVARLLVWRQQYAPFADQRDDRQLDFDQEQLRQLRSLGYIGDD